MAGRCGSMFSAWNSHNKAAILLNIDGLSSALDVPALIIQYIMSSYLQITGDHKYTLFNILSLDTCSGLTL